LFIYFQAKTDKEERGEGKSENDIRPPTKEILIYQRDRNTERQRDT
jgi:hypothetical protein